MITIRTNSSRVLSIVVSRLNAAKNTDAMLRTIATNMRGAMKNRIHEQGLDSAGQPIGRYSKGYMVVRTGAFKNADRNKKGKKKGELKNSGTFTDQVLRLNRQNGVFTGEDKIGKKRPNYNRTNDDKVIISLTRKMENGLSVTPTDKGYGIGYLDSEDFKKVHYVEHTYNKKIFKPTTGEYDAARETARNFHHRAVNGQS